MTEATPSELAAMWEREAHKTAAYAAELEKALRRAYPYVMDAFRDAKGLPAVARIIESDLDIIAPLIRDGSA